MPDSPVTTPQKVSFADLGGILRRAASSVGSAMGNALEKIGHDPVTEFLGSVQKQIESTPAGANISQGIKGNLSHPEGLFGPGVGMLEGPEGISFEDIGGVVRARPTAKPTSQATVSAGGTGALSSEELARPEVFVKYSRSGQPTYLGKQPDANLQSGEAILAVNKSTGAVRVQNTSGLADSAALEKFGNHIRQSFGLTTR